MVENTYSLVKFKDGKFDLNKEQIPKPGPGEVLIKVEYSTCSHYDGFIYSYMKNEGQTLGSDGSGIILEVGEGVSADLIGKKASFNSGAWAEYRVVNLFSTIVHDDSTDLQIAANGMGNPLTAAGMLDVAKKLKAQTVVVSAAASQLGQQFIRLALVNGIKTIGIVRKSQHLQVLKDAGAVHSLNLSEDTYLQELEKTINEHKPSLYFDFIGGQTAADIFHKMPPGCHMVLVGVLSKAPHIPIDSGNVLFNGKHIEGFTLYSWLYKITEEERNHYKKLVADDLRDGGKIFGTKIVKTSSLNEWEKTLSEFDSISTEGKILIKCQP